MKTRKQIVLFVSLTVVLVAAAFWFYQTTLSATRIALVNFPNFQTASIAKSTHDAFIRVQTVELDQLDKLKHFDAALIFSMGIRLTETQRATIQELASKGLPVYSTAVTNPENDLVSLDSIHIRNVKPYLENGSSRNYQSLLRYIRSEIDGKLFFATKPDSVVVSPRDAYYHMDPLVSFATLADYEAYRAQHAWHKPHAPKIAIVGSIGDPFSGNRMHLDSLIVSLEHAGMNVYPMISGRKRMEMLKEIEPDAVVYMPHGRLQMGQGERAVEWLKSRNIPMFCPLTILRPETEWYNDPMGMMGGFLSQSVVMPELDGGIYSYALVAQTRDDEGYYLFKAIPERLKNFTQIVSNFIRLKQTANSEKKIAVCYLKGPGQSALNASGLEVIPSLHHFLLRLKQEGYQLGNLPDDLHTFEKLIMEQGAVMGAYAHGSFERQIESGKPELVEKETYEKWVAQTLPDTLYQKVTANHGEAPGEYLSVERNGKSYIAISRLQFGNVVLFPQPPAALGDDQFKIVHGVQTAPPHAYIAAYLWAQKGFGADALLHFGTHGSLEFTPQKQVALSSMDWPDRLVGTMPHFYLYTIANVGEGIIAKRRSYATLVSHLNPPFMETEMRNEMSTLNEQIRIYHNQPETQKQEAALKVKKLAVSMGFHRDLKLDSNLTVAYKAEEIERIENFADELGNEKMMGRPYTLGEPYEPTQIHSSVLAMAADPIAYSMAALDRERGVVSAEQLRRKQFFTQNYLIKAQKLVATTLQQKQPIDPKAWMDLAQVSDEEFQKARQFAQPKKPSNMEDWNKAKAKMKYKSAAPDPVHPAAPAPTEKEKKIYRAILELERTASHIHTYQQQLLASPQGELDALVNALGGGYIAPSPGGDAVANPNTLPTGRNLFSINAEATPSESAWEKGVQLAKSTLEHYMQSKGSYPRKVSYTFWSGEFIESEGATIAQVLYMLGVEPVRDPFGRVSDLRLIPSEELGRPRVDVVIQTSGQFRDLGASRLMLIQRAVEMASQATDKAHSNQVAEGTVDTEKALIEKGLSPQEARNLSLHRIFGGVNGNYGTGIMGLVENGDRWESEDEIADTYLRNMGAYYGSEATWGAYIPNLLEAALQKTDLVVQPRQNNTWGAISLDHVYEFMGGMSLAVRKVTGKDPEAYFSDYRNRNNVRMQEVKEAVGVEARTTLFNKAYLKEQMKGGASGADNFAETFRNIYGWNVMKPATIDKEMWDELYRIYVKDELQLGIQQYFEQKSPAALQEMTAVMLETARKGYWKASESQLHNTAQLHARLVDTHGAACSGFVCDNGKLKNFIAQKLDQSVAEKYSTGIAAAREVKTSTGKQMLLKKEVRTSNNSPVADTKEISATIWWIAGILFLLIVLIVARLRNKKK